MARRARREKVQPEDGSNPYVRWAWGPGRPTYFLPGLQAEGKERMPLLLQVKGISAQDFVDGKKFIDSMERLLEWQTSLQVLFADIALPRSDDVVSWVLALATKDVSDTIASDKVRNYVPSVILGRPLDTQSLPPFKDRPKVVRLQAAKPVRRGARPKARTRTKTRAGRKAARRNAAVIAAPALPPAIVMGVIDDGIAIANERFQLQDGTTRVENWWLMDGPANNPAGGHKLDKVQIDNLLAACRDVNGVLDEEQFYRRAQLIDFRQPNHKSAAQRAAHGTHVMDLACGFDPADNRDDRPIVCVQLPTRVTADVDLGNLYPHAASAIRFIVSSALDIAAARGVPHLPVVINFSYGRIEGPHDGTHPIELVIEAAIEVCRLIGFPLRVVLPAGNSYLSRTHAQRSFQAAGETQTLNWRVLPDDPTGSFVEIWLPAPVAAIAPPPSRLTVTVTDPTGANYAIDETDNFILTPFGALAHVRWLKQSVFIVFLLPTSSVDPSVNLTAAGIYKIGLTHTGGLAPADVVHAWVARDETLPGYPKAGRQSFFDDAAYQRVDDFTGRDVEIDNASVVRRESTISSMATGLSPIVMAGVLRKEMVAAKYSAAGVAPQQPPPPPPPDLTPRWPDAMAASDDSRIHAGILAAGTRSNSVAAVQGTSVAAPQIARRVADDLAAGGQGDRARVRGWAQADEGGYPLGTPPQPPRHRSGAGRIATAPLVRVDRYEP